MTPNTTVVFIQTRPSHQSIVDFFPHVYTQVRGANWSEFWLSHSPTYPFGTTVSDLLSALGQNNTRPPFAHELSPTMIRTLRSLCHELRSTGGTLHLVASLDLESPYGSRRLLESTIRLLAPSSIPVAIHGLAWHLTPSELHHGVNEMRSWQSPLVQLASIQSVRDISYPHVISLFEKRTTSRSLDEEIGFHRANHYVDSNFGVDPSDIILVLGPKMTFAYPDHSSVPQVHFLDDSLSEPLQRNDAYHIYSDRPEFARSYFGREVADEIVTVPDWSIHNDHVCEQFIFLSEGNAYQRDEPLAHMIQSSVSPIQVAWLNPFRLNDSYITLTG